MFHTFSPSAVVGVDLEISSLISIALLVKGDLGSEIVHGLKKFSGAPLLAGTEVAL